eukprot:gene18930-24688_t
MPSPNGNGTEDLHAMKETVAGVLKEDGTLGKIQAELRAAVYFAMEAANSGISNAATEPSPLATNDGRLTIELIREFLAYFELSCTDNVLVSEAGQQNVGPINREALGGALAVDTGPNAGPLLFGLVGRMFAEDSASEDLPMDSISMLGTPATPFGDF